ncbi:MAG: tetratricopeptide repeat protein [Bacteroidota bacterium]
MKKAAFQRFTPLIAIILLPIFTFSQGMQIGPLLYENVYPLQSFGDDTPRHLMLAQTYYQLFDQERTMFALNNAVLHNPNSVPALLKRSQFKEMIGLKTEAAEDLRRANSLNPYAGMLYGLNGQKGMMSLLAFQPKSGLRQLSTEKRLNYYYDYLYEKICEGSMAEMELDLVEVAMENIETNKLTDALSTVNNLLGMYPNSAIGYDLKGLLLLKNGQLDEADQMLKKAVNLEPGFAIAWYNLGRVAQEKRDIEAAEKYFNEAILLKSDLTTAYFDRALLRKTAGDAEGAISDYDRIIKMRGDNYLEAFLNRGLTRKMLGDFNGALSDINKAIQNYPEDAMLYKNRGNLYFMFNQPRQAIEDYNNAIELNPDLAAAYFNRGLAHFIIQDTQKGCKDLNKAASMGYEKATYKLSYFCTQ